MGEGEEIYNALAFKSIEELVMLTASEERSWVTQGRDKGDFSL